MWKMIDQLPLVCLFLVPHLPQSFTTHGLHFTGHGRSKRTFIDTTRTLTRHSSNALMVFNPTFKLGHA